MDNKVNNNKKRVVCFSKLLEYQYSELISELGLILYCHNVDYTLINHTKDIRIRDFMPILTDQNKYLMYKYFPEYLSSGFKMLISNPEEVWAGINLKNEIKKTNLIIEGANILLGDNFLIMTDIVFKENYKLSEKQIINKLRNTFEIEKITILPIQSNDKYGSVDSVLRIIEGNRLLLANLYDKDYLNHVHNILINNGFDIMLLIDNSYKKEGYYSAVGNYINFLELDNIIIMPLFDHSADDTAAQTLEHAYKKEILGINCRDLAASGGVLNSISWEYFD